MYAAAALEFPYVGLINIFYSILLLEQSKICTVGQMKDILTFLYSSDA